VQHKEFVFDESFRLTGLLVKVLLMLTTTKSTACETLQNLGAIIAVLRKIPQSVGRATRIVLGRRRFARDRKRT